MDEFTVGRICTDDRRGVRIWAPGIEACKIRVFDTCTHTEEIQSHHMTAERNGFFFYGFERDVSEVCYDFQLPAGLNIPDPYALANIGGIHGRSLGCFDTNHEKRPALSEWKGVTIADVVIMEIHIGTFTPEGTFDACSEKLDYIAETGITVIQLMPILLTPGDRNWGYDPVSFFTLNSHYGTFDDLCALVDAAHDRGIAVVLDCVFNHLGPEGNYLGLIAPQIFDDHLRTPWGNAINLDGNDSDIVQSIILQSLQVWLGEVGVDGIRIDAGEHLRPNASNDFLLKMAAVIRKSCHHSNPLVILEHDLYGLSESDREQLFLDDGFNLLWNHALLTPDVNFNAEPLEKCGVLSALAQQIVPHSSDKRRMTSPPFTNFLRSHDTIGNVDQHRRNATVDANQWRDFLPVLLLTPLVPMVFMGDEWYSDDPFHFFCDLNDTCEQDICNARAREFQNSALAHSSPMSDEVFRSSKLDWRRSQNDFEDGMRRYFSALLQVRRNFISPLMSDGVVGVKYWQSENATHQAIRYSSMDGKILTMMCSRRGQSKDVHPDCGSVVFSSDCFDSEREGGFSTSLFIQSEDIGGVGSD